MPNEIDLGFSDELEPAVRSVYSSQDWTAVLDTALSVMTQKLHQGTQFPYFPDAQTIWDKPKSLSLYVVDTAEGQALNLEARGKDYATNVLSYPSALPSEILNMMEVIELGELVLCHQVIDDEARAQGKTLKAHLTHLVIHGLLHLLGFDHEISDADADEMESFEIQILEKLGIQNPYLEP